MRILRWATAALLVCVPAWAFASPQDAKKDAEKKSTAPANAQEALAAVQKELQETGQNLRAKFEAATTQEEKNAIKDQFFKARADMAPKLLAVAEKFPKESASLEAAYLSIMFGKDVKNGEKAVAIILAHHVDDERIEGLLGRLGDIDSQLAEKLLKGIAEKATKKEVKEAARTELNHIVTFAIGKVIPEVEGEDSDGKKFKMSDYRGKVVLLDFWAGW